MMLGKHERHVGHQKVPLSSPQGPRPLPTTILGSREVTRVTSGKNGFNSYPTPLPSKTFEDDER